MTGGALNAAVPLMSKRHRSRLRVRPDREGKARADLLRGRNLGGRVAFRAIAADGGVAVMTPLAITSQSFQVTVTGARAVTRRTRQRIMTRVLES